MSSLYDPLRIQEYTPGWQATSQTELFLAGDIGGTNSNFGLLERRDGTYVLRVSAHARTQKVFDYRQLLIQLLSTFQKRYRAYPRQSCWGIAGVISNQRRSATPSNIPHLFDALSIREDTELEELIFINDFEAVGLGLQVIDPRALILIHTGKPVLHAQKGYCGAGTGLGQGGLIWSESVQMYFPIASEGGHGDCVAHTLEEYELLQFIQKKKKQTAPVTWEDLLSGAGIISLYEFLGISGKYASSPLTDQLTLGGLQPDLISRYAQEDKQCADTFKLYATFYGRCAKNTALTFLARNGFYIAGGIATHNPDLVSSNYFKKSFFDCQKQSKLLADIPLWVITDYNISLYGAASFLHLKKNGVTF